MFTNSRYRAISTIFSFVRFVPTKIYQPTFLFKSSLFNVFVFQGTGLQGQAVFRTKLSFRPHSTDSQTHKKMTLSMADRSSKTSGIKVISQVRTTRYTSTIGEDSLYFYFGQVGVDPEANRWERMKAEEGKLRDAMRR